MTLCMIQGRSKLCGSGTAISVAYSESCWHSHDTKLDASLYGPVFPPGHFSRAPRPAKISDRPSIFHNNNIIIKLKLLGMCVYKNG